MQGALDERRVRTVAARIGITVTGDARQPLDASRRAGQTKRGKAIREAGIEA